ncbi:MAG TPA: HprK-related kinase B [Marinagarivorans sp.]
MTHSNRSALDFSRVFLADKKLIPQTLYLDFGRCYIAVDTNTEQLYSKLKAYFSAVHCSAPSDALAENVISVTAIECAPPELDVPFVDWARETGKTGRKDAFYDLADGRIIKKVRTGMLFLQSRLNRIACGPCLKNESQVINFINTQYMNWLQHKEWLICHASAFVYQHKAIGVAAFSGGGKSTFMLKALDHPKVNYLTNDRLFIKNDGARCKAAGIPKLPRVNPGTIINNPALANILPPERIAALRAIPKAQLWDLEEKYDVLIDEQYGENRIESEAELESLLVLNWRRDCKAPTQMSRVDIRQRADLLSAIMKSPGAFYSNPSGNFERQPQQPSEHRYTDVLSGIKVYEVTGAVDFAALKYLVFTQLLNIHE